MILVPLPFTQVVSRLDRSVPYHGENRRFHKEDRRSRRGKHAQRCKGGFPSPCHAETVGEAGQSSHTRQGLGQLLPSFAHPYTRPPFALPARLFPTGFLRVAAHVALLLHRDTRRPACPALRWLGHRTCAVRGSHRGEHYGLATFKWEMDWAFMQRPHSARMNLDNFYDYRTNVPLDPAWQEFLRTHKPKTIIFWGQDDVFFTREGGEAFLKDLPGAEMHRLEAGHFAVEDHLG